MLCWRKNGLGVSGVFENQYGEAPPFPFGCSCMWCMACELKIEYITYGGPKPQLSKNQRRKMNRRAREELLYGPAAAAAEPEYSGDFYHRVAAEAAKTDATAQADHL